MTDRERDLQAIKDTYAQYRAEGRNRLWDVGNRGYARMTRDRDRALVRLLALSLPASGGRVLDLGCGAGSLAGVARDARLTIGSWTGVDLDPEQIGDAGEAYPWATFAEASADALPFAEGSFDVVVASTLFSSLPRGPLEIAAAAEAGRVLAPGGWLVWYDLRYPSPGNRAVHPLTAERLRELFPGWHADLRSITLLPPLARRLGPLTRALYSALHRVAPLRSHLVGRLQRPT